MFFGSHDTAAEAFVRSMLFVDDHPIYREGLRRTLELDLPDFRVTVVGDAASALALIEGEQDFDLCLSDYRLPDGDGLTLLQTIRRNRPSIALGLLCADLSIAHTDKARAIGAVLCLSKDRTPDELSLAISTVFQGGEAYDAIAAGQPMRVLSPRRREILSYASEGWLDKQICEKLGVSESTIRSHWVEIFEQLQVGNRTEAVSRALRLRLI